MDSDDSQIDFFATQLPEKKSKLKSKVCSSSAPLLTRQDSKAPSYEYLWLVIFKWGGDIDFPFEAVALTDLIPKDYDKTWLTGIMSPKSRRRYRDISIYPDFSISVFGKMEKGK